MDPLERKLWAAAQYRAAAYGFEPQCEAMLKAFISAGVQNLGPTVLINTAQTAMVEVDLIRFIDAMISEAQRTGLKELHEPTFIFAQQSLCPLWPFC
jgi:hypothetical protein